MRRSCGGAAVVLNLPLPTPRTKLLCCFRPHAIVFVVVVVIVAVVVVYITIINLATIDSLNLSLVLMQIDIYPLIPAPNGFDAGLESVPGLDHHSRSGHPHPPPSRGFPMALSSRPGRQSYWGVHGYGCGYEGYKEEENKEGVGLLILMNLSEASLA